MSTPEGFNTPTFAEFAYNDIPINEKSKKRIKNVTFQEALKAYNDRYLTIKEVEGPYIDLTPPPDQMERMRIMNKAPFQNLFDVLEKINNIEISLDNGKERIRNIVSKLSSSVKFYMLSHLGIFISLGISLPLIILLASMIKDSQ